LFPEETLAGKTGGGNRGASWLLASDSWFLVPGIAVESALGDFEGGENNLPDRIAEDFL
jgi:hypothetical protein